MKGKEMHDKLLTDNAAAAMDRASTLTRRLLSVPKTNVDAAIAKVKTTKKKQK